MDSESLKIRRAAFNAILPRNFEPQVESALGEAPSNIALVKYWGKRDVGLNLPVADSLSISLRDKGTRTQVSQSRFAADEVFLDNQSVPSDAPFYQRLKNYLDCVRPATNFYFKVETWSTVPVAAGLASSASGFAALVLALDKLFGWQLETSQLSILARLGSGSAARSLFHGFAYWSAGSLSDGRDSFATPIACHWPEFRVGVLLCSEKSKTVSSTQGMLHTQHTSPFFSAWPNCVARDIDQLQTALQKRCFTTLGEVAEHNAIAMHALMHTARPSLSYHTRNTYDQIAKVLAAREAGIEVYFTQDAGPHLKLLFIEKECQAVQNYFPEIEIITPMES